LFGPNCVVSDIWDRIASTRFVIADLSGRNANVFYELGLCHGLGKRAVLLTQSISDVPFDLRHMRCVEYSAARALDSLSPGLVPHIRECISTLPKPFRHKQSNSADPASVVVTELDQPEFALVGQPFEITIKATNLGRPAKQGYFSLSFPDGVDELHVVRSTTDTQIGKCGDQWAGGRCTLAYAIAEAFRPAGPSPVSPAWNYRQEHSLVIQARVRRQGLLWFHVSASGEDWESGEWRLDPADNFLELDQRREPVYTATIDIRSPNSD